MPHKRKYYTILYDRDDQRIILPFKATKNLITDTRSFAGGFPAILGGTVDDAPDWRYADLRKEVREESGYRLTLKKNRVLPSPFFWADTGGWNWNHATRKWVYRRVDYSFFEIRHVPRQDDDAYYKFRGEYDTPGPNPCLGQPDTSFDENEMTGTSYVPLRLFNPRMTDREVGEILISYFDQHPIELPRNVHLPDPTVDQQAEFMSSHSLAAIASFVRSYTD